MQVTAGNILWFPIPDDTFIDREDGTTNNLRLLDLQKPDGLELTPMSWIKLNTSSKTLFGLPMEVDVGRQQYILAAVDREGRVAKSAFEVVVEGGPSTARRPISHEFSVVLNTDYQEFLYKVGTAFHVTCMEIRNWPGRINVVKGNAGHIPRKTSFHPVCMVEKRVANLALRWKQDLKITVLDKAG